MVGSIDIHKLTLEELSGVVGIYPWYGAARMELCRRMSEMGALSDTQISETALHICSRRLLADLVRVGATTDCSDRDARRLVESYVQTPAPAPQPEARPERQVFVVGGDYFSQAQYGEVRKPDDNLFSKFASKEREDSTTAESGEIFTDFCTETLAKVYLEQDYRDEAIEIYSKLSLRYPEKSVYFATLIDEIKQNK